MFASGNNAKAARPPHPPAPAARAPPSPRWGEGMSRLRSTAIALRKGGGAMCACLVGEDQRPAAILGRRDDGSSTALGTAPWAKTPLASSAACVRLATRSRLVICFTCAFTVLSDIVIASAISLFDLPFEM